LASLVRMFAVRVTNLGHCCSLTKTKQSKLYHHDLYTVLRSLFISPSSRLTCNDCISDYFNEILPWAVPKSVEYKVCKWWHFNSFMKNILPAPIQLMVGGVGQWAETFWLQEQSINLYRLAHAEIRNPDHPFQETPKYKFQPPPRPLLCRGAYKIRCVSCVQVPDYPDVLRVAAVGPAHHLRLPGHHLLNTSLRRYQPLPSPRWRVGVWTMVELWGYSWLWRVLWVAIVALLLASSQGNINILFNQSLIAVYQWFKIKLTLTLEVIRVIFGRKKAIRIVHLYEDELN
jgi:hypothetical protein